MSDKLGGQGTMKKDTLQVSFVAGPRIELGTS